MTLRPAVSERDHVVGRADARLTLVEYGDYQCPYCASTDPVVRALQIAFTGELRFVFRNFPLTEIHPAAEPAAEFAESAATQGKFWEVHDAIFAWSREKGPESLGVEAFESIALGMNLDTQQIEKDVSGHRYLERIRNDFNSGVRSGVNGTPTFFVNGQRFDGPATIIGLTEALKAVLSARH